MESEIEWIEMRGGLKVKMHYVSSIFQIEISKSLLVSSLDGFAAVIINPLSTYNISILDT